jgi:hypothetical protein
MAYTPRTLAEIEEAMLADKAGRPALDAITTTSGASVFLNLIRSIAASVNLHENAFAGFTAEMETRAAQLQIGVPQWYAAESLVFQLGDSLTIIGGEVTYDVIDESKQIVKLAAADKENGFLILKVAKLDTGGNAVPLSSVELAAFSEYWSQKKFACVPIDFISQDGDIARISYRVGVDATVINPANGTLLADGTTKPVEVAITNFLQTFQAENFNSVMRIVDLTDAIQTVSGVVNPVPISILVKPFDGVFSEVIDTLNDEYTARSGYILIDSTVGFTLSDTLTYYSAK